MRTCNEPKTLTLSPLHPEIDTVEIAISVLVTTTPKAGVALKPRASAVVEVAARRRESRMEHHFRLPGRESALGVASFHGEKSRPWMFHGIGRLGQLLNDEWHHRRCPRPSQQRSGHRHCPTTAVGVINEEQRSVRRHHRLISHRHRGQQLFHLCL